MEKKKVLVYILIVLFLVLGLFFYFVLDKDESVDDGSSKILNFLVTEISDGVFIKKALQNDFIEIEKEELTEANSTIKTSKSGRAVAETSGGAITVIDRNSEIILSFEGDGTTVNLISGNIWSHIAKIFEKGEFYEVKTQNAVATVRGTSFGTLLLGETTTFLIKEGTVLITPFDLEGNLLFAKEKTVSQGFKVIAKRGSDLLISKLNNSDLNLEWYLFNNPKDKIQENKIQEPTNISSTPPPTTTTSTPVYQAPKSISLPKIPEIISVKPTKILIDRENIQSAIVFIEGKNLFNAKYVTLGPDPINYLIEGDTSIKIDLNDSQQSGVFDISIIDQFGNVSTLENALEIINGQKI